MLEAACAALVLAAADPLPQAEGEAYAAFGRAAAAIPFEGETLDRLTVMSRLATEPDPDRRRRLFLSLDGVRATMAGPAGQGSTVYLELVRLRREAWARDGSVGSPFEKAAQAWGIAPETLEAWLLGVLSAWRDARPAELVEPWDLAWSAGAADRALARELPRDRMIEVAKAYVTAMGAPPKDLHVELDLAPRRGKDPVAFTDFIEKPKWKGDAWRGGRYRVSASYREGGLGNLNELVHELGHAIHLAAIRPDDPTHVDWPDDDVFTEALAEMIGASVYDPAWERRFLGASADPREALLARLQPVMLDICWALFEWRVHRDPAADPDRVWADLTSSYLRVAPHPEIAWWAVRGQLLDSPGYMMNYALGAIVTECLREAVARRRGGDALADPRPGLYLWLARNLYRFGSERPSREVVERFLAGPIDPAPLVATISRAGPPR